MRRFHLERIKDISGISGCGVVAEGVEFLDTRQVVLHWIGDHPCTNIYQSIEDVKYIHGHGGSTIVVFDDKE
ncbi:MAG: hypothetical protein LC122_12545 [Chitinophagales bacterium]|nr:hypothetical protein [Chitinophagales bacterium]